MRLSSLFIVAFGVSLLSYPAMNLPVGEPYFAKKDTKQAEPVPKPTRPKTEFALLNLGETGPPAEVEKNYKIVINIPATRLTLFEDAVAIMEFPIAVGQLAYKTPVMRDQLKELIWNPWWYPPDSPWAKNEKITPPGPRNPLGPVKMPLSDEVRIHGTSKPWSIGQAASHACIRMFSKDAETLAWFIQTHFTDKGDPSYLEKYKKFGSTSFHVKLDRPIPVDIIYKSVAFLDDAIILYPDLYGKTKDVKDIAMWEMFTNGVDPWEFDLSDIKKPSKKAEEISIHKLKR